MPSENLVAELMAYAVSSPLLQRDMGSSHPKFKELICRFLRSTLDEVRVDHATEISRLVLRELDFLDADQFREGVFRREASGNIAFDGQRDHTSHTVHNWLLGWYIYEKCPAIRTAFVPHFSARSFDPAEHNVIFGSLWPYVSLLHDIGYIFEGSLGPLDSAEQSKQAQIGANIVNEYFHSRFWTDLGFSSNVDRAAFRSAIGGHIPHLAADATIGVLASELAALPPLRAVEAKLNMPVRCDTFDLWEQHYRAFNQPAAAARMVAARKMFEHLLFRGLPGLGIRVMDHGMCSGLILQLVLSFYYELHFTVDRQNPRSALFDRFLVQQNGASTYTPEFWWRGLTWATAATSIHNLVQTKFDTPLPKVTLAEDPLAFLGILVDSVEEWDRHYVFKRPGRVPIQAIDVQLCANEGKVQLTFADAERAQKATKELDRSLLGWDAILEIR